MVVVITEMVNKEERGGYVTRKDSWGLMWLHRTLAGQEPSLQTDHQIRPST